MALSTGAITLEQVCTEIGLTGSNRTLAKCYENAVSSGFNSTYGSINSTTLGAFRGYSHDVATMSVTPNSILEDSAGGTNTVTISSPSGWSAYFSQSWITGTTSGPAGNATISVAKNLTGSTRNGYVSYTSSGETVYVNISQSG